MPGARRGRESVAIDTVPLPETQGKVSKVGGEYFLTAGKRKLRLTIGPIISPDEIDKLVGKTARVLLSPKDPSEIIALGPCEKPPKWIICYIPVPEILRAIQQHVRPMLINKMVSEGIITREFARELNLGARRPM
jgi:hypothetical protein